MLNEACVHGYQRVVPLKGGYFPAVIFIQHEIACNRHRHAAYHKKHCAAAHSTAS